MKKPNQHNSFLGAAGRALTWRRHHQYLQRAGEAHISRRALKDFPSQLGGWRQVGEDIRFDNETEKILSADDYLSRKLVSDGRMASFYVGYYATQRNGATYHSPLNCLPGSGWS